MKTVKKQFLCVSVILLVVSPTNVHSRAFHNAAIAEAATINSTSPQLLSASGRVVITLRDEGPSGRASVSPIQGARITFTRVSGTGPVPSPVLTDANGNWNQSGFVPFDAGTGDSIAIRYRATPSLTGLAFDPAFKTFNATKLDRSVADLNFEARRDSAVAFGRVTTHSGRPVPGVTVTVPQGGQAETATTDSQGRFSIVLSGAFSTLRATPSFEGFRFEPPFRDFTRQSASQLNFKLPDTFSVGGTLKSDQQGTAPPAPNATVRFLLISGEGSRPLPVRSDANGNFKQTGFSTGCTYRIEVLTSSGRVCATRVVKGEFNGRINCL